MHRIKRCPQSDSRHYSLKNRLRRQCRCRWIPLWKPMSTPNRCRWPAGSKNGGTTSGVRHWNPSILKSSRCVLWSNGCREFLVCLTHFVHPGGIVSDFEKAKALAGRLEIQFQPMTVPLFPTVIEMVDVALKSYFLTPAHEPKLTKRDEVQEAIRVFRSSRLGAQTLSRIGSWSIFPSEQYQSSLIHSLRSPSPSFYYSVEGCSSDIHP